MSLLTPNIDTKSYSPYDRLSNSANTINPGFIKSGELSLQSGLSSSYGLLAHAGDYLLHGKYREFLYPLTLNPIGEAIASSSLASYGVLRSSADTTKQAFDELNSKINAYDTIRSNENTFSGKAGDFIGSMLNPVSLSLGIATGGAGDVLGGTVSSTLERLIPMADNSIAKIAIDKFPSISKAGGAMAGFNLQDSINQSLDNKNSIDFGRLAKSISSNYLMGMAIEPFAMALGKILKKAGISTLEKIRDKNVDIKKDVQYKLNKNNALSDNENNLLNGYINNEPFKKLNDLAKKIYNNSPVIDSNGKINLTLSNDLQMNQYSLNAMDELYNNLQMPKKTILSRLLSDIQLNRELTNEDKVDALRGYIFHESRALKSDADISSHNDFININRFISKSIKKLPENKAKVSQKTIYEKILSGEYNGVIPDNLRKKYIYDKHAEEESRKIDFYNKKISNEPGRLSKRLSKINIAKYKKEIERIKESMLKFKNLSNSVEFKSYDDEIAGIRSSIIDSGGSLSSIDRNSDYKRLIDMADNSIKSKPAKKLLAEILYRRELEKRNSFLSMANSLMSVKENGMDGLDKSKDAIDYARESIDSNNGDGNIDYPSKESLDNRKSLSNVDISLLKQKMTSKEMINQLKALTNKKAEVSSKKGVFEELNKCIGYNL